MRDVYKIVDKIDYILRNVHSEPLDKLGSYIVGETIVRDDFEEIQEKYPLLESIAELGADLETLHNSPYAKEVYEDIVKTLNQFKSELK
ncbi:MAG TPA: hypothetical protein VFQ70_04365 [Candidatus Saccharimonadaceae bacterium]|nr:hypothetical protein [Candidatus Saccharimonadaceae bacterium]